jgi:hypothetical protein
MLRVRFGHDVDPLFIFVAEGLGMALGDGDYSKLGDCQIYKAIKLYSPLPPVCTDFEASCDPACLYDQSLEHNVNRVL